MTNDSDTGTRVDEIADGIYRIHTPFPAVPGGFSFNPYLVVDEEPQLFHTGLRRIFPAVLEAIARVLPVERLRHVALDYFSHSARAGADLERLAAAQPTTLAVMHGRCWSGDGASLLRALARSLAAG